MLVVDASALVDLLVDTPRRPGVEQHLATADELVAPEVMPLEVASAIWRMTRGGMLETSAADDMLTRLARLPIELVTHAALIAPAWRMRERVRLTDGLYLALATRLDVPLLTTDIRLARGARGVAVIAVAASPQS